MSDKKKFFLGTFQKILKDEILQFYTNKNGTFNPTIELSGGNATWYIPGYEPQTTETPSFNLNGSLVLVRVELDASGLLQKLDLSSQSVFNELVIGDYTSLDELDISNNQSLISLVFSGANPAGTDLILDNTGLLSVELNGFTKSFSAVNTGITSLSPLVSGSSYGYLNLNGMTGLTTIDTSEYVATELLSVQDSSVDTLTGISTSGDIEVVLADSGISDDLGNLSIVTQFDVGNTQYKSASFLSIESGSYINFKGNDLTNAQINQLLVELESTFVFNATIDISGLNGSVDSTSGGINGWNYLESLEGRGNTILFNSEALEFTAGSTGNMVFDLTLVNGATAVVQVNGSTVETTSGGQVTILTSNEDEIRIIPSVKSDLTGFELSQGSLRGTFSIDSFSVDTLTIGNSPFLSSLSLGTSASSLILDLSDIAVSSIDLTESSATSAVLTVSDCSTISSINNTGVSLELNINNCNSLASFTDTVAIDNAIVLSSVPSLSSLNITGTGVSIDIDSTGITSLDLSNVTFTSLSITGNVGLTSVTGTQAATTNVTVTGNLILNKLDLGNVTLVDSMDVSSNALTNLTFPTIPDNSTLDLSDNLLSSTLVNTYLEYLAALVVTGCNIELDGTNSVVSYTAGGINGYEEVDTLVAQGNNVNVNYSAQVMTFTTNLDGEVGMIASGSGVSWTTSRGNVSNGPILSFNNNGTETKIWLTFTNALNVTNLLFEDCGLIGDIPDLSIFANASDISVKNNPELTGNMIVGTGDKDYVDISNTAIESLDMNDCTRSSVAPASFGRSTRMDDTPNLTVFTESVNGSFPIYASNSSLASIVAVPYDDGTTYTTINIDGNSVLQTITGAGLTSSIENCSALISVAMEGTKRGGDMIVRDNPLLTSLTINATTGSEEYVNIDLSNNDLTGQVDFDGIALNGAVTNSLKFSGNPNLTSWIGVTASTLHSLEAENCDSIASIAVPTLSDTGIVRLSGCATLSSVTLSAGGKYDMDCTDCTSLSNLDISGSECTRLVVDNTALVTLAPISQLTEACEIYARGISTLTSADLSACYPYVIDLSSCSALASVDFGTDSRELSVVDLSDTALAAIDLGNRNLGSSTYKFNNLDISSFTSGPIVAATLEMKNGITTVDSMNNVIVDLDVLISVPGVTVDLTGSFGSFDQTSGGVDGVAAAYHTVNQYDTSLLGVGVSASFVTNVQGAISPSISGTGVGNVVWTVGAEVYNTNNPVLVLEGGETTVNLNIPFTLAVEEMDFSSCGIVGALNMSNVTVDASLDISGNTLLTSLDFNSDTELNLDASSTGIAIIDGTFPKIKNLLKLTNCTSLATFSALTTTSVAPDYLDIEITNSQLVSIPLSSGTPVERIAVYDNASLTTYGAIATGATPKAIHVDLHNNAITGVISDITSEVEYLDLSGNSGITAVTGVIGNAYVDLSNTGVTNIQLGSVNLIGGNFNNIDVTGFDANSLGDNNTYNFLDGVTLVSSIDAILTAIDTIGEGTGNTYDFTGSIGMTTAKTALDTIAAANTVTDVKTGVTFTSNAATTIKPSVSTINGSTARWEADGVVYNSNSPTITIGGSSVVVTLALDSGVKIRDLYLIDCSLVGGVDITSLTVSNSIIAPSNPSMTDLEFTSDGVPLAVDVSGSGLASSANVMNVSKLTMLDCGALIALVNGDEILDELNVSGSQLTTKSFLGWFDTNVTPTDYIRMFDNPLLTSLTDILGTDLHLQLNDNDLTGVLDLNNSSVVYLDLSNNTNATGIVNLDPTSEGTLLLENTWLTGANQTVGYMKIGIGKTLNVSNNSGLSGSLSYIADGSHELIANGCQLTSLVNLSNGGAIDISYRGVDISNNQFTTFPTNLVSTSPGYVKASGNPISGSVDLSNVQVGGYLLLESQTDITSILISSIENNTIIDLSSSITTAGVVNKFLVDLDTLGISGCTINIGGTNPIPDGTSGGYDGLTAKANLEINNTFL